MNIAFLFNSDHEKYHGFYGLPIMNEILQTNILQQANRYLRISIGDVLTYGAASDSDNRTYEHLEEICRKTYIPYKYNRLHKRELEKTFRTATVYCWVVQNISEDIALHLDTELNRIDSYLGSMGLKFSYGPHLALFRNSLCEEYRLFNKQCSIFYHMNDNEDPDLAVKECFEKNNYIVEYENIGARRTIFDNYDTLEHFKRVEEFKKIFSNISCLNEDIASDITFFLEELHPKLFDILAAASKTLQRAETEEDFAQVAISGRRLMERISDYLFPPRKEPYKGRDVGQDKFKNRIWAYIEDTINDEKIQEKSVLKELGNEADRLLKLFNEGLHAELSKEKIEKALADIMIWLSKVINLSPKAIRRPYLAYEDSLTQFMQKVIEDIEES